MSPSESAQANTTGKSNQTSPQIHFSNVDVEKEPVKVASTTISEGCNSTTAIFVHVYVF